MISLNFWKILIKFVRLNEIVELFLQLNEILEYFYLIYEIYLKIVVV